MSVTHKKIPYLRRAQRTLLSQDMEKKERRKSIYSTCKENYKKEKKCLQFMGKSCIVSICQRWGKRPTMTQDTGKRANASWISKKKFKKVIDKNFILWYDIQAVTDEDDSEERTLRTEYWLTDVRVKSLWWRDRVTSRKRSKKTRASIFKSQEVLQNNFILESLILAQDERWRRA